MNPVSQRALLEDLPKVMKLGTKLNKKKVVPEDNEGLVCYSEDDTVRESICLNRYLRRNRKKDEAKKCTDDSLGTEAGKIPFDNEKDGTDNRAENCPDGFMGIEVNSGKLSSANKTNKNNGKSFCTETELDDSLDVEADQDFGKSNDKVDKNDGAKNCSDGFMDSGKLSSANKVERKDGAKNCSDGFMGIDLEKGNLHPSRLQLENALKRSQSPIKRVATIETPSLHFGNAVLGLLRDFTAAERTSESARIPRVRQRFHAGNKAITSVESTFESISSPIPAEAPSNFSNKSKFNPLRGSNLNSQSSHIGEKSTNVNPAFGRGNLEKPTEELMRVPNKDKPNRQDGLFLIEPEPVPVLPVDWGQEAQRLSEKEVQKVKNLIATYRKFPLKFVKAELGISTTVWRNDRPLTSWFTSPHKQYPLWSKQREILEALVKHKRVAVKSCHGPGKTYIAAVAAIYLAYCWKALGVTTAPTGRQVRRLLWGEIHDIWNKANTYQVSKGMPGLGGKLLQTSLELGDKWFVEGFSTDRGEFNIPGFHEETVFAIVDEACGVKPVVFDLLETILSSANAFVLFIGNPTDPTSEFRKCFLPNSDFYPITIHAKDTPNVKHRTTIYPKMTAWDWPQKMLLKWGRTSALYKSRIEAEFPKTAIDGLIPAGDLLAALERELPEDLPLAIGGDIARFGGDRIVIGLRWRSGRYRELENFDKARLTKTAGLLILHQRGYANQRPWLGAEFGGAPPTNPPGSKIQEHGSKIQEHETNLDFHGSNLDFHGSNLDFHGSNLDFHDSGTNLDFHGSNLDFHETNLDFHDSGIHETGIHETNLDFHGSNSESISHAPSPSNFMDYPVVNVDDIGVGGGVTDMLVEESIPVNGINVCEAPNEDESLGEDQRIQFVDKRAFYYWKLKQAFADGRVDIEDEELAEELSHIKTEITSRGKIKIIEKDKIRKSLGRSPDKAETMMLAWSEETAEDSREMIRFL